MENPKIITISDLLQRSRPLTGASSLNIFSSSSSIASTDNPQSRFPTRTNPSSSKPSHLRSNSSVFVDKASHSYYPSFDVLEPIDYPTLIIGTLDLPSNGNSKSVSSCGYNNGCLSFSDGSSRVCCDVLDLDIEIIGRKIHVIAWSFIPLESGGGGFLEIIKWRLPDSLTAISRCSNVDVAPSVSTSSSSSSSSREGSRKACLLVGRVESVSPVSVVPCKLQSHQNSTNSRNVSGFLVELMVYKCESCSSEAALRDLKNPKNQGERCHLFDVPVKVYFVGSGSSWHPIVVKLISNVISITGLRKKLVSTEKKDSWLMYITTDKSTVRMVPFSSGQELPIGRTVIKGSCESGGYCGYVTGVYMQGMVIELDGKVWLLLTDQLLAPPHALRIGAFMSLKNVHFVRPKLSWTKILLLGSCFKTSMKVTSFSPLRTQCHIRSQGQTLLTMLTESLVFSARFWLLLTLSSFKTKFSHIFSKEELLGSKHEKGLIHMYASSCLPSCLFRPRRGVFTEFCKHNVCCCCHEPEYIPLTLVAPLSNFISHCKTMWATLLLKMQNDPGLVGRNNSVQCEGKFYSRMTRRIMPSKDIGILLMGILQISPSTGQLQLIDATGSIDVVIPDFPLSCRVGSLYEVRSYSVVMEGVPEEFGDFDLHDRESLSCRNIFHHALSKTEIKPSAIYVHFYLKDAVCLNGFMDLPFCEGISNDVTGVDGGVFHLLLVTSKFPVIQNFQGDPIISAQSSLFAEAIVLPWHLRLSAQMDIVSGDRLKKESKFAKGENSPENMCSKRLKLSHTSDKTFSSVLRNTTGIECDGSPPGIPCLVQVRSFNKKEAISGFLLNANCDEVDGAVGKSSSRKVLLEFKSESISRYQLLRVGIYYMVKYGKGEDSDLTGSKTLVISRTPLWSLSFSSNEVMSGELRKDHPSQFGSANDVSSPESSSSKIFLENAPNQIFENTDVNLYLSGDAISLLKVTIDTFKDAPVMPVTVFGENANVSACIGTGFTAQIQSCVRGASECRLPEGNLVSIYGNVVDVHSYDCNSVIQTHPRYEGIDDIRLRFLKGIQSICIHISEGPNIVRLSGVLSRQAYPVGMGPGVTATFHRVLVLGRHNLMLTPASFIVINSVKEVNHNCSNTHSHLWFDSDNLNHEVLGMVSPSLISDIPKYQGSMPLRFRGRVVAIHILVLEKKVCKLEITLLKKSRMAAVNIPLACFILDDGSSLCCCWASAERAAFLLRLHEQRHVNAGSENNWKLKSTQPIDDKSSVRYHLEKILDRHHKITMRNDKAVLDLSYQDYTFSVNSDRMLSSLDNKLLKLIVLNACCGPIHSIMSSKMDWNVIKQLEELNVTKITMHSMQHIWARDVQYVNPREEAGNMIQELL